MKTPSLLLLLFLFTPFISWSQEWYRVPEATETSWISFENQSGAKGNGGKENKGAKGKAFDVVAAGETKLLMDVKGAGIIQRMWMTINERSPTMLRSLVLNMYWDNSPRPAVSVPLGDFFGVSLGRMLPFQTALFSSPEGRSFNFTIPMPYRTAARITLTNESNLPVTVFYDIAFQRVKSHGDDVMYFHAYWTRVEKTKPGADFEILPQVKGRGRFLGTNMGVITNPLYENSWWGEGEVKIYLDGDKQFPSLNGTGTEDYIGTGWGQGVFNHTYQGCLVADQALRQWAFYRYHVPDPVYFSSDCRVIIQVMGGDMLPKVREYVKKGAPLIPVSIASEKFVKLFEMNPVPDISDPSLPEGWMNFYREDDFSATAYFYLDKPVSGLPALQDKSRRIALLPDKY
jgi:Protein of unknown function (DUF2961)